MKALQRYFTEKPSQAMLIVMCLCILVQMLLYNYLTTVKLGAASIHAWRQADCFSFAYCFSEGLGSFWEPVVNNLGGNDTGKAASDFPIIQYIVGLIWKLTGVKPFIFRLISIIIFFTGIIYLYKTICLFTKNNYLLSILLTALAFTSFNLAYYGVSVISDIHALSFSFIAIYFFFSWEQSRRKKHLIFAILAFSLAGLLKMSAGLSFFVCITFLLVNWLFDSQQSFLSRLKSIRILNILVFFIPVLLWWIWYSHVNSYNEANPTGFFLIGILPIWQIEDGTKLLDLLRQIIYTTLPKSYPLYFYFFILVFFLTILFTKAKKFAKELLVIFSCIFLFISFILLFFQVLDVHDYYYINLASLVALMVLFILRIVLKSSYSHLLSAKVVLVPLLIIVIFYTWRTKSYTRGKYEIDNHTTTATSVFTQREEALFHSWSQYTEKMEYGFIASKKFNLQKLGITKTDTVYCMGDFTINRCLVTLKLRGYSNYNIPADSAYKRLATERYKNVKYLVVLNPKYTEKPEMAPFLTNRIFSRNGVSIFKLH